MNGCLNCFHNEYVQVKGSAQNALYCKYKDEHRYTALTSLDCDDYVMDCEVEDSKPSKADIHMEICNQLNAIYKRKNADYGDSFAKARKEISCYTLGKLYDKFERYKQLSKQDRQVDDETIEDTLSDMANYIVMELIERRLEAE